MIKYLLIVFNSLLLFLYGIFNGDNGITVTSDIPATMAVGQEVRVAITVRKGSMSGFAKLQLDLPTDFEVKEVDEKGATYTFNEGIAKWVWAVLPMEDDMVVTLVLVPTQASLGPKTIGAKYSYVENNVKQVVEMVPAEVNVVSEADFAAIGQPASTASPAATTTETTNLEAAQVTSNIENPGSVSLRRTIERLSGTEYEVSILIAKGTTKGFARYSDLLPQNVNVKSNNTEGSSFSLADGKIKFVWVSVPEKDTLKISYIISSTRIQAIELSGEYSYLEDNQSKKQETKAQSLAFETPVPAAKTEETEPATAAVVTPSEPAKQSETNLAKETKPVMTKSEKAVKTKVKKNSSSTKASKPEITNSSNEVMVYHVQIGAFTKKKVTAARLEKKFKVTESINSEMAEGYTKFMVGNHAIYKDARDHREKMIQENKIKSSFVVAYNYGKRITVQEALSITNQQWYK